MINQKCNAGLSLITGSMIYSIGVSSLLIGLSIYDATIDHTTGYCPLFKYAGIMHYVEKTQDTSGGIILYEKVNIPEEDLRH